MHYSPLVSTLSKQGKPVKFSGLMQAIAYGTPLQGEAALKISVPEDEELTASIMSFDDLMMDFLRTAQTLSVVEIICERYDVNGSAVIPSSSLIQMPISIEVKESSAAQNACSYLLDHMSEITLPVTAIYKNGKQVTYHYQCVQTVPYEIVLTRLVFTNP